MRRDLDSQQSRLQAETQALAQERIELETRNLDLEKVKGELTAARSQTTQEALEKQTLAARVVEEQRARTELTNELAAARERDAAGQKALQLVESQLQQGLVERANLESSLQAEAAERRQLQLQSESQRATLDDLTSQLKEMTDAQAAWRRRDTELEDCVRELQERITETEATLALQESELRGADKRAADLLLIQSALCAKVRELTDNESCPATRRKATVEQRGGVQKRIQDGQRKLAALARKMGGTVRLGASTDKVVRFEVVLPVGISSPPGVSAPAVASLAEAGEAPESRRQI